MSDIPKFLSKQELELQEVNYIFSLRAERDELQEQLNTAKKALTEIVNANDNLFLNVDGRGDLDTALDNARDVLAAIGGGGCPAGPIGKNGLTKEEIEGSGDE